MRNIHWNPIWRKEIKLGSRSIKFPLAVMGYAGILALVAIGILSSAMSYNYYWNMTNGVDYATLTGSFTVLAYVQLALICVIVPILTAGSIAGERERQTLDLMLTAPVTPFQVVMGKLAATLSSILLFVIGSLPAMAICFLYGGIQWYYLLIFVIEIMAVSFFVGAIGIWCSSIFKKTIVSVIMTLVVQGAIYLATVMAVIAVYAVKYNRIWDAVIAGGTYPSGGVPLGSFPLLLLLNPIFGAVDGIGSACYGYGAARSIFGGGMSGELSVSALVEAIAPYWSWISLAVTVLMGFGFAYLAARRIDSVRLKGKRMRKREK